MEKIAPHSHGEGLGIYRLPSPCKRWLWGHTGGTPGYVTFAAGSRDGRRFYVVDWNGVSSEAIRAMDEYLDELICRD
jgi:D-alanyl-D-alanine carboxypeptidase